MPTVKIVSGPSVNAAGQIELIAEIRHLATDPAPYRTETFLFARSSATAQAQDVDSVDGWPLLDDGTRAPAYTLAEARQRAMDANPTLPTVQALVAAVPAASPSKATVDARWASLVDMLKDQFLGQPYLPAGRTYRMVARTTLDVAEVQDTIKRFYDRTVAAEGVGAELLPELAALPMEFTI